MTPDTTGPTDPREAIAAWCQALRAHYAGYRTIFRELGDAEAVPASAAVGTAAAERLRALVMARAPVAERQIGMLINCRLRLAEVVAHYVKGFRVGVADAPALAKELDAELARLDAMEAEARAALGGT